MLSSKNPIKVIGLKVTSIVRDSQVIDAIDYSARIKRRLVSQSDNDNHIIYSSTTESFVFIDTGRKDK